MTDYKNIIPKAQSGDPKALDELYRKTSRAAMYEDMESILNPVPENEMHFIQYQFVYKLETILLLPSSYRKTVTPKTISSP